MKTLKYNVLYRLVQIIKFRQYYVGLWVWWDIYQYSVGSWILIEMCRYHIGLWRCWYILTCEAAEIYWLVKMLTVLCRLVNIFKFLGEFLELFTPRNRPLSAVGAVLAYYSINQPWANFLSAIEYSDKDAEDTGPSDYLKAQFFQLWRVPRQDVSAKRWCTAAEATTGTSRMSSLWQSVRT